MGRPVWVGNNQLKKINAREHNQSYVDEKIAKEVEARRIHRQKLEHLRRTTKVTRNGEPCEFNIDDAGLFIVPGEGEYEVTTIEDPRGPLIITGGELGRIWAREHIARIKAGNYNEMGTVRPVPIDPHYYRRSRW